MPQWSLKNTEDEDGRRKRRRRRRRNGKRSRRRWCTKSKRMILWAEPTMRGILLRFRLQGSRECGSLPSSHNSKTSNSLFEVNRALHDPTMRASKQPSWLPTKPTSNLPTNVEAGFHPNYPWTRGNSTCLLPRDHRDIPLRRTTFLFGKNRRQGSSTPKRPKWNRLPRVRNMPGPADLICLILIQSTLSIWKPFLT